MTAVPRNLRESRRVGRFPWELETKCRGNPAGMGKYCGKELPPECGVVTCCVTDVASDVILCVTAFWSAALAHFCIVCRLLPVLWLTSCFRIMEQMGQNHRRSVCFVEFYIRDGTGGDRKVLNNSESDL